MLPRAPNAPWGPPKWCSAATVHGFPPSIQRRGPLAHLVEHRTFNPAGWVRVPGGPYMGGDRVPTVCTSSWSDRVDWCTFAVYLHLEGLAHESTPGSGRPGRHLGPRR